ncbi:hypothetical protein L3X38_035315 [Prunus dulcis]|uniref:Uncharacterized protein n=1 Tax=Prunus dulcis TaxID=3755 RepID=A0AAD4YYK3_PRUDU|nr:hypothetical protein L3X38_035315 [Prunus dulcis]
MTYTCYYMQEKRSGMTYQTIRSFICVK